MNKSVQRFFKIYPWYAGFTGDLLFYIAIDTLFLTIVKEFSPAQIVSLNSLSLLICIGLQFPILFIIKKIGNTASVRTGAFLLLLSAVVITLGKSYYVVLLGRIFHDAAAIFHSASIVALENNLEMADQKKKFVRLRTAANTVYSVITMLIAFVASYMFNLDHYLPMFGCITTCAIGFLLSLLMKDCSDFNKISVKKVEKSAQKIRFDKILILSLVTYAIFYPLVNNGQSEGKLFIQQHILLEYDVEKTALILGAVICVSRVVRVFSNVVFERVYKRFKSKMGIILPILLCISIGSLLFGSFIPQMLLKLIVMAFGYTILLFVRDPFRLCIQDVVLENSPKEQHQTLLTTLEFGVKVAGAAMGLGFSAILVGYPMILVISLMFAITLVEILLCAGLVHAVTRGKKKENADLPN